MIDGMRVKGDGMRLLIFAFVLLIVVSSSSALCAGADKDEVLTPTANARSLLRVYYPDMDIHAVFMSRFNKPASNNGRFAAVVLGDSLGYLKVVEIKGRDIKEIFEARYNLENAKRISAGFTFGGEHLISVWLAPTRDGIFSSLEIYPLDQRHSKPIFMLSDVENLSIDYIDDVTMILMQRWQNIINADESVRPSKAIYFILGYDPAAKKYRLIPHLTKLAGADRDVSARLNNQAIEHYRRGNLRKAEDLFRKVVDMAGAGTSISRRNLILVQREIQSLEMQKMSRDTVLVSPNFDDARLAFFTGNYRDCINLIRGQGRQTTGDRIVMLAVCYAQLGMWGDLNSVDRSLEKGSVSFRKEYLSYMVDILEGLGSEVKYYEYLKKLEEVDENHPNLIAHKTRILAARGHQDQAGRIIDNYLSRFQVPPIYHAKLAVIRYELACLRGDSMKMAEMEAEVIALPKPDLSYLVEMLNYAPESVSVSENRGYPLEEFEEERDDTDWFIDYLGE